MSIPTPRARPTAGVVLAAGASSRMGTLKPLLVAGDGRRLGAVQVRRLEEAGCRPVLLVAGCRADEVRCSMPECVVVENRLWPQGRVSSVQAGLRALPERVACLLLPVDTAGVRVETLRELIEAARAHPAARVLRPYYRGKRGCLAWIAPDLFPQIMRLDASCEDHARLDGLLAPFEVPVACDDPAIVHNVNTPEAWAACARSFSSPVPGEPFRGAESVASAPGKIILSGEHAVVHGAPALAMAVNRRVRCRARYVPEEGLSIDAPAFGALVACSFDEARRIYQRCREAHAAFLEERLDVREILRNPGDFLVHAALRASDGVPPSRGLKLLLDAHIPVGCGMGSSAAVAAAMLAAIREQAGCASPAGHLFELTLDCERLQHGRPSGIDPYAAVHGGAFRYSPRCGFEPLDHAPAALLLAHTGEPTCSTGECVAQVRKNHGPSGIWSDFTTVCGQMAEQFAAREREGLQAAIRENHRLLTRIGVVPARVQAFIRTIEERGGAAKVCGAGAVRGEQAGMVWIVADDPETVVPGEFGYPLSTVERTDTSVVEVSPSSLS